MRPVLLDMDGFAVVPRPDHRRLHRRRLLRAGRADRLGQVHRHRRDDLRALRHGAALEDRRERDPVRARPDRRPRHRAAGLRRRRPALRRRPGAAPDGKQIVTSSNARLERLARPGRAPATRGRRADRVAGRRRRGRRQRSSELLGLPFEHFCTVRGAAAGRVRRRSCTPASADRQEILLEAARRPALRRASVGWRDGGPTTPRARVDALTGSSPVRRRDRGGRAAARRGRRELVALLATVTADAAAVTRLSTEREAAATAAPGRPRS